MSLLNVILQAPTAGGPSQWSGIVMIVAIVAIFYFLMIRPQQKRQKEIRLAREAMKVGDSVVTSGGLYGKIKEIADKHMILEVADGVKIKVDKSCVFATIDDTQGK